MLKASLNNIFVVVLISLQLVTVYQLVVDDLNYRWGVILFTQLPYIVYFLLQQLFKFKESDIPYKLLFPITLFGAFYSLLSLVQFLNIPNALALLVSSSYTVVMSLLTWYLPKLPIDKNNASLKVGSNLPNVIVEDQSGNPIPLSALNTSPNLFIFYRGNWCAFCMAQLSQVVGMYKKIENIGIRVVLVSPQSLLETQTLAKKHNVNFTYLVDKDFKLDRKSVVGKEC